MDEVLCPICRAKVPSPQSGAVPPWFPFCGQRCRSIDLGRWADGRYVVPGRAVVEGDDDDARGDRDV